MSPKHQRSFASILAFFLSTAAIAKSTPTEHSNPKNLKHAITLYGDPKYPSGFSHFDYVNPDAPKGGELKQAAVGTFDSLNPYTDRGTSAAAMNLMYDTLLARSWDEPLTKYGLLAEKIEQDLNNNWVAFHINPKARFHDGQPVTAKDVKFTFDTFREKGSTFYKNFFKQIDRVEVTSSHRALFVFKTNTNKELPLILGQMPVMPEHYWKNRDFRSSGLEVPVGSGPYKAIKVNAGRSIVYERVNNYWGKDLAVNKGRFNFDRLRYEYYRDNTVAMEALLAGEYDFKLVDDPRTWKDHLKDSTLKKSGFSRQLLKNGNPQTLTLTYNTRKPILKDIKVREALGYGFDFNWINTSHFHNMYNRADSYFAGTQFASTGLPGPEELKLLNPWKKVLPPQVFTQAYVPPGAEEKLNAREKKKKALALLKSAGYSINKKNGLQYKDDNPLTLEVLVHLPEHEKTMLVFQKGLAALGIKLSIRTVDAAQYVERVRSQDFEMVAHVFPHTPSPGTEQNSHWGSTTINEHGSRNLAGANLPIIDKLTEQIGEVNSLAQLKGAVKAMDRVLLWHQYSLPLWYMPVWPVVRKDALQSPKHPAPFALDLMTWWYDSGKKGK